MSHVPINGGRGRCRALPEIDRQTLLVGVECGEDRATLPIAVLRLWDAADEAGAIGPGRRLEVDDFCPEKREDVAGKGTGPIGRHVQHPQPFERSPVPVWPFAGDARRQHRRASTV